MMTYMIVPGVVNRGPLRNTADAGCGRADRGAEGWNWNPAKSKQTLQGQGRIIKIASVFSKHKFNVRRFITIP